jgi:hypothetical protein
VLPLKQPTFLPKIKSYFKMVNGELKKEALYSGTEPLFDGFSSKQEIICYK